MASTALTAEAIERLKQEIEIEYMGTARPSLAGAIGPSSFAQGIGSGVTTQVTQDTPGDLVKMIAMRLRAPVLSLPFYDIHCRRAGEQVHVFAIVEEKDPPVVLSDEWGLFPSDKLITQLRLLSGK